MPKGGAPVTTPIRTLPRLTMSAVVIGPACWALASLVRKARPGSSAAPRKRCLREIIRFPPDLGLGALDHACEAAVNIEKVAVDVARRLGGQENRGTDQLRQFAPAAGGGALA